MRSGRSAGAPKRTVLGNGLAFLDWRARSWDLYKNARRDDGVRDGAVWTDGRIQLHGMNVNLRRDANEREMLAARPHVMRVTVKNTIRCLCDADDFFFFGVGALLDFEW